MMTSPVPLLDYQNRAPTPLIQALREQGWCWTEQLFPDDMLSALYERARVLPDDALNPAGIGRASAHHVNAQIRRDKTRWLDGEHQAEQHFLTAIAQLQTHLNQQLLLGLFNYECHFARYEPGDYYRKHVDALQGQRNRVLSSVIYLNPDWRADDGGELVLYDEQTDQELARIAPHFGHAVFFLSEQFPHEVLPSQRQRHSIAGWFRVRTCNP